MLIAQWRKNVQVSFSIYRFYLCDGESEEREKKRGNARYISRMKFRGANTWRAIGRSVGRRRPASQHRESSTEKPVSEHDEDLAVHRRRPRKLERGDGESTGRGARLCVSRWYKSFLRYAPLNFVQLCRTNVDRK